MKGFSIIVCCYNSEKLISETLIHLGNLVSPKNFEFEIILIDNNCTDNTVSVARDVINNLAIEVDFIVVKESKPGLTNARIKGILSSKYEYLILCDDDNWLQSDYLLQVEDSFKNFECDMVGGMGVPKSDLDFPDWFYEFGQGAYAVGNSGRVVGFNQLAYGAGLAIRRLLALKYCEIVNSLFLEDRKSTSLSSGGDSELCYLVGLNRIYFNDKMIFTHFISEKKLNQSFFLLLNQSFGKSEVYLFFYKTVHLNNLDTFYQIISLLLFHLKRMLYIYFTKNKNLLLRAKFSFSTYYFKYLFKSLLYFISYKKRAADNISFVRGGINDSKF